MSLLESAKKHAEKAPPEAVVVGEREAPVEEAGISTAWLVLPGVGQALDFGTTVVGLRKGAREANPLVAPLTEKLPLFAALKLGIGIVQGLAVKALHDGGHERAAKVVSAVSFAGGAIPAVHNIKVIRGL